jgi:hypothetical protein
MQVVRLQAQTVRLQVQAVHLEVQERDGDIFRQ